MKNKNQKIVTAIIIAIYAVTLLVYICFLGIQFGKGQKRSEVTFQKLTSNISDILNEYDLNSDKFKKAVTADKELDFFDQELFNLAGFQLTVNDTLIYSYPSDLSKSPATKSSLINSWSSLLTAKDGTPVNLTAAIYLLLPSTIINGGKVAFIVILVATALAAIFLVYAYLSGKSNSENPEEKDSDTEDSDDTSGGNIFSSSAKEEKIQPTFTPSSFAKDDDSDSIVAAYKDDRPSADELFNNTDIEDITNSFFDDTSEKSAADDNSFMIDDQPVTFIDETPVSDNKQNLSQEESVKELLSFDSQKQNDVEDYSSVKDEVSEVEDLGAEIKDKSKPAGLFSEETNVGYEPYLLPRLNNELVRSAEQEQDLSLLLLKIPGLQPGSLEHEKICSLVIDTVKFQDLIFEFGKDGFSAIFQNTTIDDALSIADELEAEIQQVLSSEGKSLPVAIGISSKSFRLISGERLANEAAQALEHALKNPDKPIVAFKVNADQYRNQFKI